MCIEIVMNHRKATIESRTNVVLDMALVNRVRKTAGVGTIREALHVALDHYVRSRNYSAVLALRGQGGVAPGYDPKETNSN
jgi:Arc/MetJ family transcription regulator